MAEIQPPAAGPARGPRRRATKLSTKVDMTPMVDLAFLLLTFFMLTTTFAKPYVLQLTMPVNGPPTPVPARDALTILLGKNHRVHYFLGLSAPGQPANQPGGPGPRTRTTTFAAAGLRQVLLAQPPGRVVLLKSGPDAKYQDLVDLLDELSITNRRKYALVALTPADKTLLQTL